eukprot:TRINITY_DN5307_c0_g1_i7.p1 TRINITY_DN5307_c0_g1~~TRINITY_DN5307_c0_g1_i7.p1  ORF type:complete len:346 (+),score=56.42 TRINITY_DN5307_c0_g1_i7:67-1104(+)
MCIRDRSFFDDEESNKTKLLTPETPFNRLKADVDAAIKKISEKNRFLKDCLNNIGTPKDTKNFRTKMKEEIENTTTKVKEATEFINQIQNLKLTSKQDLKERDLYVKKVVQIFNNDRNEFEATVRNIATKERQFVETARKSISGAAGAGTHAQALKDKENEADQQMLHEVSYTEDLVNERQKELEEIEKQFRQVHELALITAEKVDVQGEALNVVSENITSSNVEVEKANKELVKANTYTRSETRNTYLCAGIIGLVALAALVVILAKFLQYHICQWYRCRHPFCTFIGNVSTSFGCLRVLMCSIIILLFYHAILQSRSPQDLACLLYTSPSPRDGLLSRMPSSA